MGNGRINRTKRALERPNEKLERIRRNIQEKRRKGRNVYLGEKLKRKRILREILYKNAYRIEK